MIECRRYRTVKSVLYYQSILCVLLAIVLALGGCTNPEKAKAAHLAAGEAYLKDSKFQEASIEFRNALQIDDSLAAAHWGLSKAYEGLQRLPESFEELKRTVALDPNNLEAKVKLGNVYVAGSKGRADYISEGERLAKEVLQKDPNYIEAHILLGSVLFAQKHQDQALAELNKAVELDPKRVESYLSLARFYIVTNDTAKAEETFKRAISVNNNSALAHTEYGKYLVQLGKPVEAEVELKKAIEVAPADKNSRFVLASFYLVNNQLDKAEESYKALAALDKDKPESQAVLADFYSLARRPDEAVKIYQEILSRSPDYTQGRYRLTEILMAKGDLQGANAQIEDLLKKDSHDRNALLLRARARMQAGQTSTLKAAMEDLKEVLRQEPNSKSALYFMSQANFSLGLMDQARVFLGDLIRNYPDYLPPKLMEMQVSLASGDPRSTFRLASELLDRLSKTPVDRENTPQLLNEMRTKTYLTRGAAQAQLGNNQAAVQDFMAARELSPSDTDVYNNLAVVALAENKPDEAVGFYENSLSIDNTNFVALNGFVNLYSRQGQLDKAHAKLDHALSSHPNNASLHYLKAQIYGFEKNAQAAEAELRKAVELDSNYLNAYYALAALFINTSQVDRAIAEYRKILERRPDTSAAYTLIGMLEDSRQNYDAAAENYRKALELDQNSAISANNLAWLYAVRNKGSLDEALRLAQEVVQKSPNVPGFVDTLGWVYYKKGLYSAAVEQLQKAVDLDDAAAKKAGTVPSPTYPYHLGMALKEKGDKGGARRQLEAALRLGEKLPFQERDEALKALATL
jgi:tetratricopeptide (TPR) repeat protein